MSVRPALGLGHDDRDLGAARARDQPFGAVDDVARVRTLGDRGQRRGIGTGARRRFGHQEARARLGFRHRLEEALALGGIGQ
jgi:hypothetical protein